jgi:predicted amidohydrolase YtcJ
MLADITVIDRDLRTIPPAEIRGAKILRTIVGGQTVFTAGKSPAPGR